MNLVSPETSNLSPLLQLQEAQQKLEEMNKEQESLIDIFSEERIRRDQEEENLRKKLKVVLLHLSPMSPLGGILLSVLFEYILIDHRWTTH